MKKISFKLISMVALLIVTISCDKNILDVKNPNNPTEFNISEQGEGAFISWAQGAVYVNGFNGIADAKYAGSFLGDSFFFVALAYHELMGDVVGASAANNIINQVGVPDKVMYSDGTSAINTAPIKNVLRQNNSRSKAGNNPFYYEWTYMYFLNNACNGLLENVDKVKFSGDTPSRIATLKAWAYWWKGYAYSRIGSIYYAGIINNQFNSLNGNYVPRDQVILEAARNFDLASAELAKVTSIADYETILGLLIPDFCQVGKGGVLSIAEWNRNMNTMKARNLLVNKRKKDMTPTDWANLLALTNAGINDTDLVFTGRTRDTNFVFSTLTGSVAARTVTTSQTFWPTERFMQEFDKVNDQRWLNNFSTRSSVKTDAGGTLVYGARYYMVNGGKGIPGVIAYGSRSTGDYELYIGATFEENELMKAEALINSGSVSQGLQLIDDVRAYQGAGLAPVAGTTTDPVVANEILRKERRVALAFRALSFYDARRVGFLDPISSGGGRTKAVVVRSATVTDINATIDYNFLDYWDVPDDELALNPNKTSTVVKNPN